MTRLHWAILVFSGISTGFAAFGCTPGGVGDPCVPEDEYTQTFLGLRRAGSQRGKPVFPMRDARVYREPLSRARFVPVRPKLPRPGGYGSTVCPDTPPAINKGLCHTPDGQRVTVSVAAQLTCSPR